MRNVGYDVLIQECATTMKTSTLRKMLLVCLPVTFVLTGCQISQGQLADFSSDVYENVVYVQKVTNQSGFRVGKVSYSVLNACELDGPSKEGASREFSFYINVFSSSQSNELEQIVEDALQVKGISVYPSKDPSVLLEGSKNSEGYSLSLISPEQAVFWGSTPCVIE
jgi:hypothetical protein